MKKFLLSLIVACMAISMQAQTYTVKVLKTDGTVVAFPMERIKEITVDENDLPKPQPSAPQFVEVAGVKWATGNLQYDKGVWKIAANQWDYFNPVAVKPHKQRIT